MISYISRNILAKPKYIFSCKNPAQTDLQAAISAHDMAFAIGPAGTGKTYSAVGLALSYYRSKNIHKIIIARPTVGAGESNGYLPGTLREKLQPYMAPIYDCLGELTIGGNPTADIELCSFEHARGRTFKDAFVIVDEAQNATFAQLEMMMTRIGEGSKMIITADPSQIDLPLHRSGLNTILDIVRKDIPEIEIIHFLESHNLRHPLVAKCTVAFAKYKASKKELE